VCHMPKSGVIGEFLNKILHTRYLLLFWSRRSYIYLLPCWCWQFHFSSDSVHRST
jgi:hypothetical protein